MNIKGFTLTELILTIAVVGILSSAAVPSFSSYLNKHEANALIISIQREVNLARSTSIHQGQIVTMCGMNKANECVSTWSHGFQSFIDLNNNKKLDSNEQVFSQLVVDSDIVRVKWRVGATAQKRLQWSPTGRTYKSSQPGSFVICPLSYDSGLVPAVITVNAQGRIVTGYDSDGDKRIDNRPSIKVSECS